MAARKTRKPATRRLRKEVKALKKSLRAQRKRITKTVKRSAAKNRVLTKDMDKLKAQLEKLGKKRNKKQLSEYNLFMRRQLLAGKTFNAAVRLWKSYSRGKPLVRTKVVRRTIVRTVSRPKIVTRTRTIVRRVKSKPRVITRTVVRRIASKPRVITRTIIRRAPAPRPIVQRAPAQKTTSTEFEKIFTRFAEMNLEGKNMAIGDEELALKLLSLYFEEVARLGLKRQLQMKDVLDAYYETLEKVRAKKAGTVHQVVVHTSQPEQTTTRTVTESTHSEHGH